MSRLFFAMLVVVGVLLPISAARASHHRPPPARAPEPLTLLGLGAGLTTLYVVRRRMDRK